MPRLISHLESCEKLISINCPRSVSIHKFEAFLELCFLRLGQLGSNNLQRLIGVILVLFSDFAMVRMWLSLGEQSQVLSQISALHLASLPQPSSSAQGQISIYLRDLLSVTWWFFCARAVPEHCPDSCERHTRIEFSAIGLDDTTATFLRESRSLIAGLACSAEHLLIASLKDDTLLIRRPQPN